MNKHDSSVWFALSLIYGLTFIVFGGRESFMTALLWYPVFLTVLAVLNRKPKRKAPIPDIEGR